MFAIFESPVRFEILSASAFSICIRLKAKLCAIDTGPQEPNFSQNVQIFFSFQIIFEKRETKQVLEYDLMGHLRSETQFPKLRIAKNIRKSNDMP